MCMLASTAKCMRVSCCVVCEAFMPIEHTEIYVCWSFFMLLITHEKHVLRAEEREKKRELDIILSSAFIYTHHHSCSVF